MTVAIVARWPATTQFEQYLKQNQAEMQQVATALALGTGNRVVVANAAGRVFPDSSNELLRDDARSERGSPSRADGRRRTEPAPLFVDVAARSARVGLALMSTYVLIHGSFQGGWIWKPVSQVLTAAGHAVHRPTLDGCAERKGSLRREITLASLGAEIAALLFYEDLQDVIFVGTSSGGMVVCQAAEQVPERIRRLVFIDALVPVPGESVPTINSRAPYSRDELVYGALPENARGQVFADLSPDVQDWALARYTRHPLAPTDDPVDLTDFWAQTWQVDVLRCTRSAAPPEAHQRRTAEKLGGSYAELDAGHYPMLSHTQEVARYLLERA